MEWTLFGAFFAAQDAQTEQSIAKFTLLLVVVGFLQVVVLFLQWRLIRRQDAHFRNSERAWVMAKLGWWQEEGGLHVAKGTGTGSGGETETTTDVFLKLTCRNDGRSPAWIENVYGRVDIISEAQTIRTHVPGKATLSKLARMDPLGAGQGASRGLQLSCPGHLKADEFLSAYVIVEYRDIFGLSRETAVGYSITFGGSKYQIYQQEGLPQRNWNT